MQHINRKQLWFFLIIAFMLFAGTQMRKKAAAEAQANLISDVELDEALLQDLKNETLQFDDRTACLMACQKISETDLKALFSAQNLSYENCDFRNCHLTTYAIEGNTKDGHFVQFKVETGEEGTTIRQLEIENACSC